MDTPGLSIQTHFATVTDPQKAWNQDHRLSDILVMALCGIICGADSWVSVAAFAEAKLPWFRRFLDLPNGAPSHDTFSRVFAALDPTQLPQAFLSWVQAVHIATNGESEFRTLAPAQWDTYHVSAEEGHGRRETRTYWTIMNPTVLAACNPEGRWRAIGPDEATAHALRAGRLQSGGALA